MDVVIWIGDAFYPKAEDVINEAKALGLSRKFPQLPEGIEIGKSRVFMMHKCGTQSGKIFGYFVVGGLEIIVQDPDNMPQEAKDLVNKGVVALSAARAALEPKRGCGYRSPGGVYVVNRMDQDAIIELAKMEDLDKDILLKGQLVLFPKPWPIANTGHYRGYSQIDGDELIGDLMASQYAGSINYYATIKEVDHMTFGAFTEKTAKDLGISRADAEKFTKTVFGGIESLMLEGDSLHVPGFGTFATARRAPRTSRNIHTGAAIDVPSKIVPTFKPVKKLKDNMLAAKEPASAAEVEGSENITEE